MQDDGAVSRKILFWAYFSRMFLSVCKRGHARGAARGEEFAKGCAVFRSYRAAVFAKAGD